MVRDSIFPLEPLDLRKLLDQKIEALRVCERIGCHFGQFALGASTVRNFGSGAGLHGVTVIVLLAAFAAASIVLWRVTIDSASFFRGTSNTPARRAREARTMRLYVRHGYIGFLRQHAITL